jgi:opacity protein-like surface antigen
MPYVGGGVGPVLVNYEKWFSVVNFKDRTVRFGLAPEVGVIIPFKNSGLGLNIAGRYNEVFYSHDLVQNVRYFELMAGLYFGYF